MGITKIINQKYGILFEKIKFILRKIFRGIFSTNNIAILVAILFFTVWLWGSVSAMSKNWELSRRVEERKRTLALLKLEVQTLELENAYYRTKEYQELSARRQHSRQLEGETMVILPENSVAARTKHRIEALPEPKKRSNFEQWLIFLGWRV